MPDVLPDLDLVAVFWRGEVYAVRSALSAWRLAQLLAEDGRLLGAVRAILTPEAESQLMAHRPRLGDLEDFQRACSAAVEGSFA